MQKIFELKNEIAKLKQHDMLEEEKISNFEENLAEAKEEQDDINRKYISHKEEITKVYNKFTLGSTTLQYIISLQVPFNDKFGVGHEEGLKLKN